MKLKKCSMGVTLWAALAVCGSGESNAGTNSTTAPAPSPRQAATVQAATGDGSLTDSNLTYVGRWDKSDSTTYRSYWGGAYVTTKFTGTTVKVKLPVPVHFKYIIDGTLANYWACGTDGTINLTPTPLANGTHTLKIIADINDGQLPFKGLVLDTGASTVAPDSRPVVEFIGDSITAGHSTSEGPVTDYAWLTGEADFFHPSDAGHVKIMNRLAPILKPYLSAGGVNLLSNPGFENGLSGWGVWPAGPSFGQQLLALVDDVTFYKQ